MIYDKEHYNQVLEVARSYRNDVERLEKQLAITQKALELAVNDKCYAENCIAESFIGKGAKVAVPKKEKWYLEQAKEMLGNE